MAQASNRNAKSAVSEATAAAALPLFYQEPVVLQREVHGQAGIKKSGDFRFAAGATAVPLGVGEFMPAIRHFPIVFSDADKPTPLAVLGVKQGTNLFIDADGAWNAATYIPAYVRRYPFIIAETLGQENMHLAVDTASDRFVANPEGTPAAFDLLFDGKGGPTPAAQAAIEFCQAWLNDCRQAEAFAAALNEAGLLTPRRADIQFPDGERASLDGFRVVDEEVYAKLPAATLEEWRDKGWLDIVSLHRASQQNWQILLELNQSRNASKASS